MKKIILSSILLFHFSCVKEPIYDIRDEIVGNFSCKVSSSYIGCFGGQPGYNLPDSHSIINISKYGSKGLKLSGYLNYTGSENIFDKIDNPEITKTEYIGDSIIYFGIKDTNMYFVKDRFSVLYYYKKNSFILNVNEGDHCIKPTPEYSHYYSGKKIN